MGESPKIPLRDYKFDADDKFAYIMVHAKP